MAERGGAKKNRQQQRGHKSSPSPNTMEGNHPAPTVAKRRSDKAVTVSRSLFVGAPTERCFDMLAKQLEDPPRWDPMVSDVKPLSRRRRQPGATSLVRFKLGRKEVETLTMIASYRPNQSIGWVSSDKARVREDWTLEPEPDGTTTTIILSYDAPPWFPSSFLNRFTRDQVEEAVNQMLDGFSEVAESNSSDRRNAGKI